MEFLIYNHNFNLQSNIILYIICADGGLLMNIYDLKNYDYTLPKELIAQEPIKNRDNSRLLVFDRITGKIIHDYFYNIHNYFNKEDVVVLNDTKVIPARIFGKKEKTNAKLEILLLDNIDEKKWNVMIKNSRRIKNNDEVIINNNLKMKIIEKNGKEVIVEFNLSKDDLLSELWHIGVIPLPPYIKKSKFDLLHKSRYQTIYAKNPGSKAAPTAGLHFTEKVMDNLKNKKIKIAKITLHIGLGTFNPIDTQDIRDYKIHKEWFCISDTAAIIINNAKQNNKKIIACGTTSLRALESSQNNGIIYPQESTTSLFIYPGFKFNITNCLITNFHLPKTSLYVLVCAFAGIENIKKCYNEAIKLNYRFYSYGDVMLIK